MKEIHLCLSTVHEDCIADSDIRDWYQSVLESSSIHVFVANAVQFNELRIGVKFGEIEPWSFMFEGTKVICNKEGILNVWPKGMFDVGDQQLSLLLGWTESRDY